MLFGIALRGGDAPAQMQVSGTTGSPGEPGKATCGAHCLTFEKAGAAAELLAVNATASNLTWLPVPCRIRSMNSTPSPLQMSATYHFVRGKSTPAGFMSTQRPSTDAMNVLGNREDSIFGRSFEVLVDEDEQLVARLTFLKPDQQGAAEMLSGLCLKFGIERNLVASSQ